MQAGCCGGWVRGGIGVDYGIRQQAGTYCLQLYGCVVQLSALTGCRLLGACVGTVSNCS